MFCRGYRIDHNRINMIQFSTILLHIGHCAITPVTKWEQNTGLDFLNCSTALDDISTAEMPVKFKSDAIIMISNLAASRIHEIYR